MRIAPPGPLYLTPKAVTELRRDILEAHVEAARKYGDTVRFRIGMFPWYLITHPDHVQHVLQLNNKNYRRSVIFDLLKPVVGDGLLTNEGPSWLRQRRIIQPAFHRKRISGFAEMMVKMTEQMVERWSRLEHSDRPLDVVPEMMRLTLAIVARAVCGVDITQKVDDEFASAMACALEHVNYRTTHMLTFPERIPTPRNLRLRNAIRTFDRLVHEVIESRRRTNASRDDLLSMLMELRYEDTGEGMSDKQLRDELMTFFAAGHETTAITLSWTWYLLSKNPPVARQLRAELDRVLGGRAPTFEDLPQLTYTRAVLEEALRLYPPVWAMSRNANEDDQVGGFHIPKNALVLLSPYITHRHPEFWENPEGFDPDRFLPGGAASKRHRFAWYPFGGGPRVCIGSEFALMEAQLVVATVAQRFHLDLDPGYPVKPEPIFTLRPSPGVMVKLRRAEGMRVAA